MRKRKLREAFAKLGVSITETALNNLVGLNTQAWMIHTLEAFDADLLAVLAQYQYGFQENSMAKMAERKTQIQEYLDGVYPQSLLEKAPGYKTSADVEAAYKRGEIVMVNPMGVELPDLTQPIRCTPKMASLIRPLLGKLGSDWRSMSSIRGADHQRILALMGFPAYQSDFDRLPATRGEQVNLALAGNRGSGGSYDRFLVSLESIDGMVGMTIDQLILHNLIGDDTFLSQWGEITTAEGLTVIDLTPLTSVNVVNPVISVVLT